MDEKIKTWTLRFPAKENPDMEKALFDWPIVLQYDVKAKYPLIFFEVTLEHCSTRKGTQGSGVLSRLPLLARFEIEGLLAGEITRLKS